MSTPSRLAQLALALIAVAPLGLTGCAASHSEPVGNPASRPSPAPGRVALAIEQVAYGLDVPYVLCPVGTCPKPTPKTLPPAPVSPRPPALVAPPAPIQPVPAATRAPDPVHLSVTFAPGSAALTPQARQLLDKVLPWAATASLVEIRGRTDSEGPRRMNDRLAARRARAVREYLGRLPMPATTRIELSARGLCCYAATNATALGRGLNRRVEVEFQPASHLPAETPPQPIASSPSATAPGPVAPTPHRP